MKRIIFLCMAIFTTVFSVNAQTLGQLASSVGLVDELMQTADVNKEQATAGAGALFEMAKGNLKSVDFEKISEVVPNMDQLLDAVPDITGSKTSLLSTSVDAAMNMPQVISVFEKLGISKEKISLFTPILVKWVEKKGSKHLGEILKGALK